MSVKIPTTYLQIFCLLALFYSVHSSAQDLTPRLYWPAPKGTKIFAVGYAHQSGDVIVDKSLPITNVDSKINSGVLAYQQTISLLGRTSNFRLEIPYVDGITTGLAGSQISRNDFSGFGDIRALLSINLIGAPSMNIEEFRELRLNPRPILGTSLMIVAPTGQYDANELLNIGTNRWAMRARLGYTHPLNSKWLMEVATGVWFFGDNDEFLGETRKQDPVGAIDFSLIRRFGPGFWGSLDLNYYFGGRTAISGNEIEDIQRNSLVGLTVAFPIKGRHAIRVSFNRGVVTKSGGDFTTFSLAYAFVIK
jgi:hypothetical protein